MVDLTRVCFGDRLDVVELLPPRLERCLTHGSCAYLDDLELPVSEPSRLVGFLETPGLREPYLPRTDYNPAIWYQNF
jgi:hypothetical protein